MYEKEKHIVNTQKWYLTNKKNQTMEIKNWRSEKLTPAEHRALKAWVKSQRTKEEAAKTLDIGRNTLHMISATGSGRSETLIKIRKQIA